MELKFDVTGMTCAACAARVEKVTGKVDGVLSAQVNLLSGKLTVETRNESIAADIIEAIQNAGYGATITGGEKKNSPKKEYVQKSMKIRIWGSAAFLIVLMYFTMGHMMVLPVPAWYHGPENAVVAALLQFLLTLPVVYLNRAYYSKGLKALIHKAPNMDSLIAVGSGAALIYGVAAMLRMAYAMGHGQMDIVNAYHKNLYFESAAMILTLITVGKYMESRSKHKAGDAIAALLDLSPKTATVRRNNTEMTVPVEQVQIGDVVLIRSGGVIPVDGIVVAGHAAVDESMLTGESIPVEKMQGDRVSAATMNREGYLEVQTVRVGEDTTLSQIIRMVEEAGGSKAPIARLADKIAGVFVPVVMAIMFIWNRYNAQ